MNRTWQMLACTSHLDTAASRLVSEPVYFNQVTHAQACELLLKILGTYTSHTENGVVYYYATLPTTFTLVAFYGTFHPCVYCIDKSIAHTVWKRFLVYTATQDVIMSGRPEHSSADSQRIPKSVAIHRATLTTREVSAAVLDEFTTDTIIEDARLAWTYHVVCPDIISFNLEYKRIEERARRRVPTYSDDEEEWRKYCCDEYLSSDVDDTVDHEPARLYDVHKAMNLPLSKYYTKHIRSLALTRVYLEYVLASLAARESVGTYTEDELLTKPVDELWEELQNPDLLSSRYPIPYQEVGSRYLQLMFEYVLVLGLYGYSEEEYRRLLHLAAGAVYTYMNQPVPADLSNVIACLDRVIQLLRMVRDEDATCGEEMYGLQRRVFLAGYRVAAFMVPYVFDIRRLLLRTHVTSTWRLRDYSIVECGLTTQEEGARRVLERCMAVQLNAWREYERYNLPVTVINIDTMDPLRVSATMQSILPDLREGIDYFVSWHPGDTVSLVIQRSHWIYLSLIQLARCCVLRQREVHRGHALGRLFYAWESMDLKPAYGQQALLLLRNVLFPAEYTDVFEPRAVPVAINRVLRVLQLYALCVDDMISVVWDAYQNPRTTSLWNVLHTILTPYAKHVFWIMSSLHRDNDYPPWLGAENVRLWKSFFTDTVRPSAEDYDEAVSMNNKIGAALLHRHIDADEVDMKLLQKRRAVPKRATSRSYYSVAVRGNYTMAGASNNYSPFGNHGVLRIASEEMTRDDPEVHLTLVDHLLNTHKNPLTIIQLLRAYPRAPANPNLYYIPNATKPKRERLHVQYTYPEADASRASEVLGGAITIEKFVIIATVICDLHKTHTVENVREILCGMLQHRPALHTTFPLAPSRIVTETSEHPPAVKMLTEYGMPRPYINAQKYLIESLLVNTEFTKLR